MSTQFDPEDVYETLRSEGVFEEDDEELRLTEEFREARERFRGTVAEYDDDTTADLLAEYVDGTPFEVADVEDPTFADALAVEEVCESVDKGTSVHVALSLDRSESVSEEEHVPAGFVALSGEEIAPFIGSRPASILYFWREDCEPCAAVREDLSALRHDGTVPEAVGLGAVYGPDNVELLREEYDVGAAPTVLFCSGGTVESRFVGNPGIDAMRREVELLVEDIDA